MPEFKPGARLSKKPPLNEQELYQIDAYWRAANYLTACQLYLLDNPLLERPLRKSDLKQTIVGHWGTCPGQNFIYTHLDRVIKRSDLDMIYLSGPGHGGNAMVAQDWLDGSYTEVYPNITRDKDGMQKLFKRFSFPGGIPSHVAPETPGSIHEGGELGYSLAHAFGAVADNPDLIAACGFGHTHSALSMYEDGLYVLNPGSCGGYMASYGIIDITDKGEIITNTVAVK